MKAMTKEKMREIIALTPYSELEKNQGICEFFFDGNMSIGVSYEDDEERGGERYIYNIFIDGEYVNIEYDADISLIIEDLVTTWNNLKKE